MNKLSMEAFRTTLCRVQGILNRRPIGIDEQGRAITPNHIISPGAVENGGFPLDLTSFEMLKRVQEITAYFWKRWSRSYLTDLSINKITGKAQKVNVKLENGDPVIIKDNTNPLVEKWVTGKIAGIHKSADGIIRSATVEIDGVEALKDIRNIAIMEGPALWREKMVISQP